MKEVPGRFWCNPCGLVARSFFTDTFTLEAPAGGAVAWTQEGTVWEGDLAHKCVAFPRIGRLHPNAPFHHTRNRIAL